MLNLHSKQNIYKVSSFLSYLFILKMWKTKISKRFYPAELLPVFRHEPVVELIAPRDLHLHFITFKNSVFVQKQTFVRLLG